MMQTHLLTSTCYPANHDEAMIRLYANEGFQLNSDEIRITIYQDYIHVGYNNQILGMYRQNRTLQQQTIYKVTTGTMVPVLSTISTNGDDFVDSTSEMADIAKG